MNEDFSSDFITLIDDDGQEFELEHLDTLEMDDETYMAFTPVTEGELSDDDEVEIVILKVTEEDNEETFVTIDDDDELDRVYEAFMDRITD